MRIPEYTQDTQLKKIKIENQIWIQKLCMYM